VLGVLRATAAVNLFLEIVHAPGNLQVVRSHCFCVEAPIDKNKRHVNIVVCESDYRALKRGSRCAGVQ
jgi:hypothetical protein